MSFLLLLALSGCGIFSKDACPDGTHLAGGECVAGDTGGPVDADGDGSPEGEDCDDANPAVYPGATEACDGVDNDCDGSVDEDPSTWYADADKDGYGSDLYGTKVQCEPPEGYVTDGTDCNDQDARVSPGASELCDGIDNDCNGQIDEYGAADAPTWSMDADGDGSGDPNVTMQICDAPSGYVVDGTDCDDTDPAIHPGAAETCDGVDQDCDGVADDDPVDGGTYYADADGDGYGSDPVVACSASTGIVANPDDCDDTDPSVHPGADETCDGVDQDCDGVADDAPTDGYTYHRDADADGYGSATSVMVACSIPSGYVTDATDCDDTRSTVHPGASETCDGIDDDCDGATDESGATGTMTYYADGDGDGYGDPSVPAVSCAAPTGYVVDATDCDDADSTVHPGVSETCDGVDEDCDGSADEGAGSTWYRDADADGYGGTASTVSCTAPTSYVSTSTDCDDANATVHPGATEACNGVDDDCDGSYDEGASGSTPFYRDADGDGYGSTSSSTTACDAPTGYVSDATDCDDSRSTVHPGATEVADGVDNDCDGSVDEGTSSGGSATVCASGGTYTSIQDAIDAASDGDVITVCPGYYAENLDVSGLTVSLEGTGGADATIIDGDTATALTMSSSDVTLSNLTLSGFTATPNAGAAIDCTDSTLDATHVVFSGSMSLYYQVMALDGCSTTMDDFVFEGNEIGLMIYAWSGGSLDLLHGLFQDNAYYPGATGDGGLFLTTQVETTVSNVLFVHNTIRNAWNHGVYLDSGSLSSWFFNNTLTENTNLSSGGYLATASCTGCDFENNILSGNSGFLGVEGTSSTVFYNDSYGHSSGKDYSCGTCGSGNLTQDPRFNDAATDDYTLLSGFSPCIDAGNPLTGYNDADGSRNDMGAFGGGDSEWEPGLYVWYADDDGDGYGVDTETVRATDPPAGYAASSGDCDDTSASVHLGVEEVLNGIDDNCNGVVDDVCTCDVCADGGGTWTSIQEAIDDSASGATLTVCAGTYDENVHVTSKTITLQGTAGADMTVLDGGTSYALELDSATLTLSGFTLTGQTTTASSGAAMTCDNSTWTASDLVITGLTTNDSGNAMSLVNCTTRIEGLEFVENHVHEWIYARSGGSLTLKNSFFHDNGAPTTAAYTNYFMNIDSPTSAEIANNLFVGNEVIKSSSSSSPLIGLGTSSGSGSIWVYNNTFDNHGTSACSGYCPWEVSIGSSSVTFENNILYNDGTLLGVTMSTGPTVTYNDSYGHFTGYDFSCYSCTTSATNLTSDPKFNDRAGDDYTLNAGFSPCVNAGDPLSGYNDTDGTRNDMGAFGGPGGDWDPSAMP